MATHEPAARPRLHLGPWDHGRAVSDDEFADADYEPPWRYELGNGRLVVMSPHGEAHDDATEPWRNYLGAYKLAHRDRIEKVVAEAWVQVGPGKQRIGDVGVYLVGERSSRRRPARAPEIMIEVVSPGLDSHERDFVEKRAEYSEIKVLEYVLVDYLGDRVIVLSHAPGGYTERVLTVADTYTTPLLPGLAIPLAEVFTR